MLPMLRNRLAPAVSDQSLLGRWSDLDREIDRIFASVFDSGFDRAFDGEPLWSDWMPAMDVQESPEAIHLTFEVPGVDPSDLSVTVENGTLTVSGEKRTERETGWRRRSRRFERRYGRFERTVTLPEGIDPDGVTARYEHGVLTVELPKRAEARPRMIEIQAGSSAKQLGSGQGPRRNAA